MSDFSFGPWLSGVKGALAVLASPPDVQRQHLSDLGVPDVVDELALELDDMLAPLKSILSAKGAERALSRLGELEVALGSPALEWTLRGLTEAREWQGVRRLASDALDELQTLADDE